MFKNKKLLEEIRLLKLEVSEREAVIDKLRELTKEKDDKLVEMETQLYEARQIIEKYRCLDEATPKDCKRGSYCQACSFNKEITVRDRYGTRVTYFCSKAESCKNFVQKERYDG